VGVWTRSGSPGWWATQPSISTPCLGKQHRPADRARNRTSN